MVICQSCSVRGPSLGQHVLPVTVLPRVQGRAGTWEVWEPLRLTEEESGALGLEWWAMLLGMKAGPEWESRLLTLKPRLPIETTCLPPKAFRGAPCIFLFVLDKPGDAAAWTQGCWERTLAFLTGPPWGVWVICSVFVAHGIPQFATLFWFPRP